MRYTSKYKITKYPKIRTCYIINKAENRCYFFFFVETCRILCRTPVCQIRRKQLSRVASDFHFTSLA